MRFPFKAGALERGLTVPSNNYTHVRKGAAKINEERVFWNSEIKREKGWLGEGAGKWGCVGGGRI